MHRDEFNPFWNFGTGKIFGGSQNIKISPGSNPKRVKIETPKKRGSGLLRNVCHTKARMIFWDHIFEFLVFLWLPKISRFFLWVGKKVFFMYMNGHTTHLQSAYTWRYKFSPFYKCNKQKLSIKIHYLQFILKLKFLNIN